MPIKHMSGTYIKTPLRSPSRTICIYVYMYINIYIYIYMYIDIDIDKLYSYMDPSCPPKKSTASPILTLKAPKLEVYRFWKASPSVDLLVLRPLYWRSTDGDTFQKCQKVHPAIAGWARSFANSLLSELNLKPEPLQ